MVLYSWRLSQKSDVAQSFWKRRTKQSKAKQNKTDLLGLLTLLDGVVCAFVNFGSDVLIRFGVVISLFRRTKKGGKKFQK
jgi:hypothetical protein